MRPSVRAAFVGFTAPLEGVVRWMYLDVKGLVTVGIGNLIDPLPAALAVPFVTRFGTPATQQEIATEWSLLKGRTDVARNGYRAAQDVTTIRLTDEGVEHVVFAKLDSNDTYLRRRFPDFEDWPADAQLATHSMSWACGPAFHFPELEKALRNRDFERAAAECHMDETGNHGLIQRNVANKKMYRNAARVQSFKLDPEELHYPAVLTDIEPEPAPETQPEPGIVIEGGTPHPDVEFIPPDPPFNDE